MGGLSQGEYTFLLLAIGIDNVLQRPCKTTTACGEESIDLGALGLKESEKKVTRFVQSVDTEAVRLTDYDRQQYRRLDAHPFNSPSAF